MFIFIYSLFQVKALAKERLFQPASGIVDEVMRGMIDPNDVNLPKPDLLTRVANFHRRLRPNDPTDLDFEVIVIGSHNNDYIYSDSSIHIY